MQYRISQNKNSVKIRKELERTKMSKRQKNISTLSYFEKQKRKESTEIKEHKQETNSSRPTCGTFCISVD